MIYRNLVACLLALAPLSVRAQPTTPGLSPGTAAGTTYAGPNVLNRAPSATDDGTKGYRAAGSLFVDGTGITAAGSGYTTATVTIAAPPAGGTQATAHAVISGGAIQRIVIDNPGARYASPGNYSVTITGNGSGAAGAVVVSAFPSFWATASGDTYYALSVLPGAAAWARHTYAGLPCDIGPGCFAAYSVRKVSSTYTGPALDIINPSGGATVTVSFDATGMIDNAVLRAICGTTGCRVSRWYAQGSCGTTCDATQTDNTKRPIIFANRQTGGAPTVLFDPAPLGGQSSPTMALGSGLTLTANNYTSMALTRQPNTGQQSYYQITGSSFSPVIGTFGSSLNVTYTYGNTFKTDYAGTQNPFLVGNISGSSIYVQAGNSSSAGGGLVSNSEVGGVLNSNVTNLSEWTFLAFWSSALTADQYRQVMGAAYAAFPGLTPQATNRLILKGDSITAGTNTTLAQNWARQMEGLLTWPALIYNFGSPGQYVSTAATNFAGNEGTVFDPVFNNIAVIYEGTNDIGLGNQTATATWASLQSYCTAARAKGSNVAIIAVTMTPRGSTYEATRLAYNALIRANAGACTFDAIADIGADPVVGVLANASDTTLYTDALHPANSGEPYWATTIAAAIGKVVAAKGW